MSRKEVDLDQIGWLELAKPNEN